MHQSGNWIYLTHSLTHSPTHTHARTHARARARPHTHTHTQNNVNSNDHTAPVISKWMNGWVWNNDALSGKTKVLREKPVTVLLQVICKL